jgi:hypothetical protein
MIALARRKWDELFGRGDAAITVPIMDGAFKPNDSLERFSVLAELDDAADLATDGRRLFVAAGRDVLQLESPGGALTKLTSFEAPLTAIAAMPEGDIAVAIAGREVRIAGGRADGRSWNAVARKPFVSVNALHATSRGDLIATEGSEHNDCINIIRDLMERRSSGRMCRLVPSDGGAEELAGGLEYAFGAIEDGGRCWVSESWRHRIVGLTAGQAPVTGLDALPGYPGRISRASGGGYWLSIFAARTMLVEFVLREPRFRKMMLKEVDPRYWIAPMFSSGKSPLEPMIQAGVKQMGVLKPWAPPRSYGLIVRLNAEFCPVYSLHSRIGSANHGIMAATECRGTLFALAKGPGRLLASGVDALARDFRS